MANCPQCGAPIADGATSCKYCGEALSQSAPAQQQAQQSQQPVVQQVIVQQPIVQSNNNGINPSWPIKNKVVAGVLAILLGSLGVHKFYLGQTGKGILYLLFCWTGIPAFVGFVEGILYLVSNDHNFQVKNKVRLQ